MRIWFISDTHEQHEGLRVPTDVDAVIYCGDEANSSQPHLNAYPAQKFFNWWNRLDIGTKIFVPGNHSTAFQMGLAGPSSATTCLIDESYTITRNAWSGDQRSVAEVYGSPWSPKFSKSTNWVYHRKRNQMDLVWRNIPAGLDILVTHGPPKGILDMSYGCGKDLHLCGCKSLLNKVLELRPKIHAFGHVHDEPACPNRGILKRDGITFINCSCVNLRGQLVGNGEVIEL